MNLNYRFTENPQASLPPIMLLHGLFGDLNNLGSIARALQSQASILQVDLRNHGRSPQCDDMDYPSMAEDVHALLQQPNLAKLNDGLIVIGHSMGGKVAMALTARIPTVIKKLIVLDIAPVAYAGRHHDDIFQALHLVGRSGLTERHDAQTLMAEVLDNPATATFLLKSFEKGQWRFNLAALEENYLNLLNWETLAPWAGATLFLQGELSNFIRPEHVALIKEQFPLAEIKMIPNSDHWLHADNPKATQAAIECFLHA